MSVSAPPAPASAKQEPVPLRWWMPNESLAMRIGVFAVAVVVAITVIIAVVIFARRWYRGYVLLRYSEGKIFKQNPNVEGELRSSRKRSWRFFGDSTSKVATGGEWPEWSAYAARKGDSEQAISTGNEPGKQEGKSLATQSVPALRSPAAKIPEGLQFSCPLPSTSSYSVRSSVDVQLQLSKLKYVEAPEITEDPATPEQQEVVSGSLPTRSSAPAQLQLSQQPESEVDGNQWHEISLADGPRSGAFYPSYRTPAPGSTSAPASSGMIIAQDSFFDVYKPNEAIERRLRSAIYELVGAPPVAHAVSHGSHTPITPRPYSADGNTSNRCLVHGPVSFQSSSSSHRSQRTTTKETRSVLQYSNNPTPSAAVANTELASRILKRVSFKDGPHSAPLSTNLPSHPASAIHTLPPAVSAPALPSALKASKNHVQFADMQQTTRHEDPLSQPAIQQYPPPRLHVSELSPRQPSSSTISPVDIQAAVVALSATPAYQPFGKPTIQHQQETPATSSLHEEPNDPEQPTPSTFVIPNPKAVAHKFSNVPSGSRHALDPAHQVHIATGFSPLTPFPSETTRPANITPPSLSFAQGGYQDDSSPLKTPAPHKQPGGIFIVTSNPLYGVTP